MKTFSAKFNPLLNKGVYGISLVENPAMEGLFIALSKDENIQLKEVDAEQRILMGLVLEPNKPIYRNQNGEEFNIVFDEQTIKDLSFGFFKSNSQKNSTIEHDVKQNIDGVTFVESWIIENPTNDKSNNFGFTYPKGSWMATMKVDSDEVWNDYVKTGKVLGFSIDAMLSLEEVQLKTSINMTSEILNALKDLPTKIALAFKPEQVEVAIELGSLKTADGSITIEFDGETLMADGNVFITAEDGTKVALPMGEYPLEDGTTLVVEVEGIVKEVKPMMEEPAATEDVAPVASMDMADNDAKIASEIESAIKSILIKYSEQAKEIETLKAEVLELSKAPASKGIVQTVNPNHIETALERHRRIKSQLNN